MEPATRPESKRQLNPPQMTVHPTPVAGNGVLKVRGFVEFLVVIDAEGRVPAWPAVAPAPATCGGKKRAATEEVTR